MSRVKELAQLLPLLAVLALIYLLMIRPATRRNRMQAELQGSLQPGDRVMLTSGFFGTVRTLDDDRLDLELAPGVVVSVARGAVSTVVGGRSDDGTAEATDDQPRTDTHDDTTQES